MITINTTAVIIYDPTTALYLGVSRRNDHDSFSFAGGKCEEGESTIQCAVRETEEETGVRIKSMNLIDVYEHQVGDVIHKCWTYAVRTYEGKFTPNEELIAKGEGILKWVTPQTLYDGAFKELVVHLVKVHQKYVS